MRRAPPKRSRKCEELGDGFLPAKDLGFEKVWDDPGFHEVRARMEKKLPRLDYAPTAIELEDNLLAARGPRIRRALATASSWAASPSTRSCASEPATRSQRFRRRSLDSVLGHRRRRAAPDALRGEHIDAHRRGAQRTAATPSSNTRSTRATCKRRVDVPNAVQLNDVTVAPGGRVFTTDSGIGAVYEITADNTARALVEPRVLAGRQRPRGLARREAPLRRAQHRHRSDRPRRRRA